MTPNEATDRFLEMLNFVVAEDGFLFHPDTPLAKILRPEVIYPETFLASVAHGLDIEASEIDQYRIHPETDTVTTMFERLLA